MPNLLLDLVDSGGRVTVYRLEVPWLDVGKPDDLSDARRIEKIVR
jgi:NDP-sugar pyrophosphorylase family protein